MALEELKKSLGSEYTYGYKNLDETHPYEIVHDVQSNYYQMQIRRKRHPNEITNGFKSAYYRMKIQKVSQKPKGKYKLSVELMKEQSDEQIKKGKPAFKLASASHEFFNSKEDAFLRLSQVTDLLVYKKYSLSELPSPRFTVYRASEDMKFEGVPLKANDVVIKRNTNDKAVLIAKMDSVDFNNLVLNDYTEEGKQHWKENYRKPTLKGYIKRTWDDGHSTWEPATLTADKCPTRFIRDEAYEIFVQHRNKELDKQVRESKDIDYVVQLDYDGYVIRADNSDKMVEIPREWKTLKSKSSNEIVLDVYSPDIFSGVGVFKHKEEYYRKDIFDGELPCKVVQKEPTPITWEELQERSAKDYEWVREQAQKPDYSIEKLQEYEQNHSDVKVTLMPPVMLKKGDEKGLCGFENALDDFHSLKCYAETEQERDKRLEYEAIEVELKDSMDKDKENVALYQQALKELHKDMEQLNRERLGLDKGNTSEKEDVSKGKDLDKPHGIHKKKDSHSIER